MCNDRPDAVKASYEMNLAFDPYGSRSYVDRRLPRTPIQVLRWTPAGELIAWVRDRGEWIGAVRGADSEISWIPADELCRKPDPPP